MSTKNKPKSNKVKGTRQEIKYTKKKRKEVQQNYRQS